MHHINRVPPTYDMNARNPTPGVFPAQITEHSTQSGGCESYRKCSLAGIICKFWGQMQSSAIVLLFYTMST